jgi:hypothetical protein
MWKTLKADGRLWIGLNDKNEENVYVWEDGQNLEDTNINLFAQSQMLPICL